MHVVHVWYNIIFSANSSWLGQGRQKKKQKEMETVRSIATAPSARTTDAEKERNIKTAPDQRALKLERESSGVFKRRDTATDGKLSLYTIFSRRAQLVDAGPIWQVNPPPLDDEQTDKPGVTFDTSRNNNAAGEQRTNVDILVVEHGESDAKQSQKHSEHTHQKHLDDKSKRIHGDAKSEHPHAAGETGDFMKDLLVDNAKKKYRKKKGKPIQERLTSFYTKLDELKQQEEDDVPSARETRRRYVLLTQGVQAALQYSSDEEETNNLHTV